MKKLTKLLSVFVIAGAVGTSVVAAACNSHTHNYTYKDNGDGTHTATCADGDDEFTKSHVDENSDNKCDQCGVTITVQGGNQGGSQGGNPSGDEGDEGDEGGNEEAKIPTYEELLAKSNKLYDNDFTEGGTVGVHSGYGTKGIYTDIENAVAIADGALKHQAGVKVDNKASNSNIIVDFGVLEVGSTLEGYMELQASAMGSAWNLIQFKDSSNKVVLSIGTGTDKAKFAYAVKSGITEKLDGKTNTNVPGAVVTDLAIAENVNYKLYYKFNLETGAITLDINGTTISIANAGVTSVAGVYIASSQSGARLVTVDNLVFCGTAMTVDSYKTVAAANLAAEYATYVLEGEGATYSTNKKHVTDAYEAGKAAINKATTVEEVGEAYDNAVAALKAILSDAQIPDAIKEAEDALDAKFPSANYTINLPAENADSIYNNQAKYGEELAAIKASLVSAAITKADLAQIVEDATIEIGNNTTQVAAKKTAAITALKNYSPEGVDLAQFKTEHEAEGAHIDAILADEGADSAVVKINACATIAAVNTALNNAISDINATVANAASNADTVIANYQTELQTYGETKATAYASLATEINQIVTDGKTEIGNAANVTVEGGTEAQIEAAKKAAAKNAYDDAIDAINLIIAKHEAKVAVAAYGEEVITTNSLTDATLLAEIRNISTTAIDEATDEEAVEGKVTEIKTAIDLLVTKYQAKAAVAAYGEEVITTNNLTDAELLTAIRGVSLTAIENAVNATAVGQEVGKAKAAIDLLVTKYNAKLAVKEYADGEKSKVVGRPDVIDEIDNVDMTAIDNAAADKVEEAVGKVKAAIDAIINDLYNSYVKVTVGGYNTVANVKYGTALTAADVYVTGMNVTAVYADADKTPLAEGFKVYADTTVYVDIADVEDLATTASWNATSASYSTTLFNVVLPSSAVKLSKGDTNGSKAFGGTKLGGVTYNDVITLGNISTDGTNETTPLTIDVKSALKSLTVYTRVAESTGDKARDGSTYYYVNGVKVKEVSTIEAVTTLENLNVGDIVTVWAKNTGSGGHFYICNIEAEMDTSKVPQLVTVEWLNGDGSVWKTTTHSYLDVITAPKTDDDFSVDGAHTGWLYNGSALPSDLKLASGTKVQITPSVQAADATVTFHGEDGSVIGSAIPAVSGNKFDATLAPEDPTKADGEDGTKYKFVGWATRVADPENEGEYIYTIVDLKDYTIVEGDTDLYAQFEVKATDPQKYLYNSISSTASYKAGTTITDGDLFTAKAAADLSAKGSSKSNSLIMPDGSEPAANSVYGLSTADMAKNDTSDVITITAKQDIKVTLYIAGFKNSMDGTLRQSDIYKVPAAQQSDANKIGATEGSTKYTVTALTLTIKEGETVTISAKAVKDKDTNIIIYGILAEVAE